MPEGQFTGPRKVYEYTMDSGTSIQLALDETNGSLTGTGLTLAGATSTAGFAPPRFKPRGVYWQGDLNGSIKRKFITCNAGAALYNQNVSQALEIDGVPGKTTGRRGEKLSWSSN